METAFAFLDSSFKISQHLQMLSFRNYARINNIAISFYGVEPVGYESRHDIFLDYIKSNKDSSYLFFSIDQLTNDNFILDQKFISLAIDRSLKLHFANELLKIQNTSDLQDIQLLLFSKRKTLFEN